MQANTHEQGATLPIVLVLMLVTTLSVVSVLNVGVTQSRLAMNLRDQGVALQAAESALRAGEHYVEQLVGDPVLYQCGVQPCIQPVTPPVQLAQQDAVWWYTGQQTATYTPVLVDVSEPPRFYIEHLLFIAEEDDVLGDEMENGLDIFRITARGTGALDTSQVIVQTTWAKWRYEMSEGKMPPGRLSWRQLR